MEISREEDFGKDIKLLLKKYGIDENRLQKVIIISDVEKGIIIKKTFYKSKKDYSLDLIYKIEKISQDKKLVFEQDLIELFGKYGINKSGIQKIVIKVEVEEVPLIRTTVAVV